MIIPDQDQRYRSSEGCIALAREMDRLAHNAKLLMERHEAWARALRSRAAMINQAEILELEARAKRQAADMIGNQQEKNDSIADEFLQILGLQP